MSIPWTSPLFITIMLGFTVFTGLLAGSYPAFYLSSFRPIMVLKGNQGFRRFGTRLRARDDTPWAKFFQSGRSGFPA